MLDLLNSRVFSLLDRSPAFLTFDDFIRSNEIIRTKWPIYEVISYFVLMISSERKNNTLDSVFNHIGTAITFCAVLFVPFLKFLSK